jgi:hypothetical protein
MESLICARLPFWMTASKVGLDLMGAAGDAVALGL